MKGKLYGVGVGPGDPQLLTLRAVQVIGACPVIAFPGKTAEGSVAYRIASGAVDLSGKELLPVGMPMTRDEAALHAAHALGARAICRVLDAGQDVAFLTLGDPTIYSTFAYLEKLVRAEDFETETISGVPSFCAAAARAGTTLTEKDEELHIFPGEFDEETAAALPGTKVFMKSAGRLSALSEMAKKTGAEMIAVENCGMPGERVFRGEETGGEKPGYYTLVILK